MRIHENTPAIVISVLLLLAAPPSAMSAESVTFDSEWRTSFGIVKLEQKGNEVTGVYGPADKFTLKGTTEGDKLTFEYHEGKASGDANWTLDKSGLAFHGTFSVRGGPTGEWKGWRPDPKATEGPMANLSSLWLTDFGLMELTQTGDKVSGRYAFRGNAKINGAVTGRRFEFTTKSFRSGMGWFDISPDGATLSGAASTNGFPNWYAWHGRKAPEFARHTKLEPGKIVDGSTNGLLTYSIRAPEGYREGGEKKWPAVVILHGSNMNGKAYVATIAAAWPDIAKRYLLIGINGEMPSAIGNEPTFNFSYVSYVGRSTFKGFPGTDRESPALVAEALDDLQAAYPIEKYFVGGHSQGGFLTYSMLMNFPEKIAGAFPISAGVIFQCEPSAYADDKVRASQRSVPLAIIHSKQDQVVSFAMGQYAATIFGEASWPAFRFFADSKAGHMFGLLPVNEAIDWLETLTSDDPKRLFDFAEERVKAKGYRDAVAALNRARTLQLDDSAKSRLDGLDRQIDDKARVRAAEFLAKIQSTDDAKTWIDAFLAYRDDFEFAPSAHDAMQAFDALRAKHEDPARKALNAANVAFQQGNRDAGYAKYQEIVDQHFASSIYHSAKRWLAERE